MQPITILILTHRNVWGEPLLPHLDWLKRTNPLADIRIVVSEGTDKPRLYYWKNGDKPLRKWWKMYGDTVTTEVVAVIEWDTLVGCALPELPSGIDLAGKQIMREDISMRNQWRPMIMADKLWTEANWYWWNETPSIEHLGESPATGLISFGMFLMRSWVLDAVCDPKWDMTYERSIQNELRFPTCAALSGASVGEIPLPFVSWHEIPLPENPAPGIYHAIKQPFEGEFA